MHLKKAEWCEPWMTDEEKRIMKKQMAAMRRLFIKGGIPESPFISLRAIDIGIHHLMVRRLEAKMGTGNAAAVPVPTFAPDETASAKMGTGNATAVPVPTFATLVEQIGKTRERLRKSMRELEEACARLGKPVEIGLADQLLPLVLKTQDLLHSDSWSEDIPDSDSPPNTPDISDSAARSGDTPVPESVPNTHNILDGDSNNENKTTTDWSRYEM